MPPYVKTFLALGLAICQPHSAPAQDTNLITGPADFQRFTLCVYAVAAVDEIGILEIPNTTVAAICFDRVDSFARRATLHAFGSNLPTAFVSDGLAVLERQPVVIFQLENGANVYHWCVPLSFLYALIIARPGRFVNRQNTQKFWENLVNITNLSIRLQKVANQEQLQIRFGAKGAEAPKKATISADILAQAFF